MKIGLLMIATPDTVDPATVARKAEEVGFESFWLPEHPIFPVHSQTRHFFSPDGTIADHYAQIPDPFIGLASAASVTKKIKLATGICLAAEHNPLVLAKAVAPLDHYSGGRVILGVGAGWLREEAEILGVNFSKRWLRLKECVQAMRELWTKGAAEFHSQVIDFPPVRCIPQPVQKPCPPVLVGTYTYGEKSLRRVAEWGDGWFPPASSPQELKESLRTLRSLTETIGRDFRTLDISVFLAVSDAVPCADLIKQYEGAGAQRVVLVLSRAEKGAAAYKPHLLKADEVEGTLEQLAEQSVVRVL